MKTVKIEIEVSGYFSDNPNRTHITNDELIDAVKTYFKLYNGLVQPIGVNGVLLEMDNKNMKIGRVIDK